MFLKSRGDFEWPQFPKLWLLRCQKFLKVFIPLPFCWVLPAGLGPWGLGFPRPHTAALRSCEGPRFGPRAASRGQGSRRCEGEQRRPWPRTRDFGEGKPLEAMGSLREEVDEQLMVQFFWWILLSSFCGGYKPKHLALTFCVFLSRLRFLCIQRSLLLTIFAWQYFGASIAIQNWSQHSQHCSTHPDILTFTSTIVWNVLPYLM